MINDDILQNATGLKTNEAGLFLHEVQSSYAVYIQDNTIDNFLKLKATFSAFLSAARSITFYMQKQYKTIPGFAEWYTAKQSEMSNDKELNYLNRARVENVHIGPVPLGMERELSCGIICNVVSQKEAARRRASSGKEEAAILETGLTTSPMPVRTVELFLPEQVVLDGKLVTIENKINLIKFCNHQFEKLKELVRECENNFGV